MRLINKLLELTKIALNAHHIIDLLESIGLEVEPTGKHSLSDSVFAILTDSTNLIMLESGLKHATNFEDVQEKLDTMLSRHKDIRDISEFEQFFISNNANVYHRHTENTEPENMTVKHYNEVFLPSIDRAKGFINRFELIIDHMDETKVDHKEVRRLFDLYGLTDDVKDLIIKSLEYYRQHEGLDKLESYTDVKLDLFNNLMYCPHCGESIGAACDWTPNYCCNCGKPLTGGNGRGE